MRRHASSRPAMRRSAVSAGDATGSPTISSRATGSQSALSKLMMLERKRAAMLPTKD